MPNSLHSKSRILCESGIIKDYNNNCNKLVNKLKEKRRMTDVN